MELQATDLEFHFRKALERLSDRFRDDPADLSACRQLATAMALGQAFPFDITLSKIQNNYYDMLQTVYPGRRRRADQGDERSREWVAPFRDLGEKLSFKVD